MKKIIFLIFVITVLIGAKYGYAGGDDNTYTALDSLKKGSDTTRTINIEHDYAKRFKFEYLSWRDTGASFTDSLKVYEILENGDLAPVDLIDCSTHLDVPVTSAGGQTRTYLIFRPYAKSLKLVWNGNAIYTANIKGWFQWSFSND